MRGWAPTADGLFYERNTCTGEKFRGFEMVVPDEAGNDAAMRLLRDGKVDALWIYADQMDSYQCNEWSDGKQEWDCALYRGFGKEFAYIHTGLDNEQVAGLTLSMSRKGSRVSNFVNPCLRKFKETKEYFKICQKHGLEDKCFRNRFFKGAQKSRDPWDYETKDQTSDCSSGYCKCPN